MSNDEKSTIYCLQNHNFLLDYNSKIAKYNNILKKIVRKTQICHTKKL
jgi:hypothetical protein